MATKLKKPQIGQFDQNPVEAVRDIAHDVRDSLKNDLLEASVSDAWKQLLGVENTSKESNDSLGEVIFSRKEKKAEVEPGIDYKAEIIHAQARIEKEQNRELRTRVEEIRVELEKLAHSSKQLEVTFKNVTVEALPSAPGKYHLNFFEWVLVTIKNARMRIEESTTWMNVVTRKKDRKSYWSLAKKHGTSFSLSGERVVATQVG